MSYAHSNGSGENGLHGELLATHQLDATVNERLPQPAFVDERDVYVWRWIRIGLADAYARILFT